MSSFTPLLLLSLLLLFCTVQATESSVSSSSFAADPTRVHEHGPPADQSRFCTELSEEEFECTDDPMATRKRADERKGEEHKPITMGVPQRIDGTEAEQKAIKEVLTQMDEYFYGEVLSKPEYEDVRKNCKNRSELCGFWAAVGECESNRLFMLPNCAAACRICLLLHTSLGDVEAIVSSAEGRYY